jgi:hypothetical protein
MSARIFVSHCAEDGELGSQIVALLRAVVDGIEVDSSRAQSEPLAGDDKLSSLEQRLAVADAVVGLCTQRSAAGGDVAFELGAAWGLGRPLYVVVDGSHAAASPLTPAHAHTVPLGPEALLELAASIAARTGLRAEVGGAARVVLMDVFPDFRGFDRESSERPVAPRASGSTQQVWPVDEEGVPRPSAPPPAPRPEAAVVKASNGLPSCSASLEAGRALSDCVWDRERSAAFAGELDAPFGTFLAALGGNWSMLRKLEDLDVWLEATDNLLGGLGSNEQRVHSWYEIGFQLATLLGLARAELEADVPADAALDERWQTAWATLQRAAHETGVDQDALAELHAMLDNLRGPEQERDYANLGRCQQRVRELASYQDARAVAVSA